MAKIKNVRVRFAPSPTGYLHVGGARTAIFNHLFARHHGGTFILRIEDTDSERSTVESEQAVMEDMRWLGIDWDEGPDVGGPHGPYRQSERHAIYKEVADELRKKGVAYSCFCTEEELELKREEAIAESRAPQYDGTCRDLAPQEIEKKRAAGLPEAVRFRVGDGVVRFHDEVRGDMELSHEMVGDWVILRSNGLPTYNFAAAVDDLRMEISHVIRGEEHLPNTLRQIMIYDAMGAKHPAFVHVPLILAEDRSKLSKRHGASSVGDLRDSGYLPDAAFNYLLLLGWSHPAAREIMSREEMVKSFAIERVGKAAAIFDRQKLQWMNGQYIRKLPLDTLVTLVDRYWPDDLRERYDDATRREIVAILQDSLETLADLPHRARIFEAAVELDQETRELVATQNAQRVLAGMTQRLRDFSGDFTPEAFKEMILATGGDTGLKGKELYFPIRGAMTGSVHGPDLTRVAAVKGRDTVLRSLEEAKQ
ncbi:MAG: glutamate--tRNA ligase [Candidatus Krumholzibacteria bacterium]|nr:glutamate--tRNA ligase [Candidatus Krumholzibacteria bacterium]MDH4338231.1 glutamate--tRNA ligase [Candidatus Krumholzibacteria bacterium]MDH5270560.1 glutamate--tRNA ligase [Candidatus Krumholzibacteria bacterium]MDH5626829.1 glutamate--tRNA ligase [Candidatus Krumholzibacteria bacterium]